MIDTDWRPMAAPERVRTLGVEEACCAAERLACCRSPELAGRVEEQLERVGALRGVLPFRLFSGRRAAGG